MLDPTVLPIDIDRARLRPLRHDDATAYAEGTVDPDVRDYAHLPETSYTPESVRDLIDGTIRSGLEHGDLAVLAVADTADDSFVGSIVLFDVSDDAAEVGFWLHPRCRGRGMAKAALELAAEFAASSGLERMTARTVPENAASGRALDGAGFSRCGTATGVAPSGERVGLVHFERHLAHTRSVSEHHPVRTERLSLRLHRSSDVGALHRIYSRGDVARLLLDEPWSWDETVRRVDARIRETGLESADGALALVIEHLGRPVGDVRVWWTDRENRNAEIGWVLDPDFGGRGFARESVSAVLDLAFARFRVHRIAAQMDARNEPSAALALSVGMTREAHLRRDWWSKGEWTDTLIFAVLESDP